MHWRGEQSEQGFSLIELLVVILIIGILAAIALPSFLSQRQKGQDADAKENAANLLRHVQSCYVDTQDYTQCQTADIDDAGLPLGSGPGHADAVSSASDAFTITGYSRSGGHFVVKLAAGDSRVVRICDGTAGCKADNTW